MAKAKRLFRLDSEEFDIDEFKKCLEEYEVDKEEEEEKLANPNIQLDRGVTEVTNAEEVYSPINEQKTILDSVINELDSEDTMTRIIRNLNKIIPNIDNLNNFFSFKEVLKSSSYSISSRTLKPEELAIIFSMFMVVSNNLNRYYGYTLYNNTLYDESDVKTIQGFERYCRQYVKEEANILLVLKEVESEKGMKFLEDFFKAKLNIISEIMIMLLELGDINWK